MNLPTRVVPCPSCRGEAEFSPANAYRPFCSQRCRAADLGAWASETFRLSTQAPSDDDLSQDLKPEVH